MTAPSECEHPPYAVDTRDADDAEARRYVGTKAVDEARHTRVRLTFCTICGEVFSVIGEGLPE